MFYPVVKWNVLKRLFLINKPYFETNFRLYVSPWRLTTYILLCELDMYFVYITQISRIIQ